ncbi:uncharacterized protein EV420DRAFT_1127780 [Desarmillaria tabescens]|uniref:Secreted protein n=1 Tax=Armillaria tabescens TaxID=1929756 RepID=A0AA39JGK4_ARMTA|nr:uncharacterized protein EV420DRAFT_1127780 [Desarmillaria tabescens]KAK0440949.1 hypothetical protein EV420DRAFT_1127780 [Desarmillaria tabescens]
MSVDCLSLLLLPQGAVLCRLVVPTRATSSYALLTSLSVFVSYRRSVDGEKGYSASFYILITTLIRYGHSTSSQILPTFNPTPAFVFFSSSLHPPSAIFLR